MHYAFIKICQICQMAAITVKSVPGKRNIVPNWKRNYISLPNIQK